MIEAIQNHEPTTLEQKYKKLQESLNTHGNMPLTKVLSKYPFPIYQATVDRFDYIVSRMGETYEKSPILPIRRLGAKINGVASEIGVGVADTILDTITMPLNIFFPKIRHLFYKATLFDLYSADAVRGQDGSLFFTPMGESQMMQRTNTAYGAGLGAGLALSSHN